MPVGHSPVLSRMKVAALPKTDDWNENCEQRRAPISTQPPRGIDKSATMDERTLDRQLRVGTFDVGSPATERLAA